MDIDAINDEHNTFTALPEATWADGNWGLAKNDGKDITLYPDNLGLGYVILSMEEAKALGAALLEITKEHKSQ